MHLLSSYVCLLELRVARLGANTAPTTETMSALPAPIGKKIMATGIALSTFGFLNLVILVPPHVLQAMAADGVFFRKLAELHPTYRTPAAAIVALAVCAIILTLTGTFG